MFKQSLLLVAAIALAGCANEPSNEQARLATGAPTSPELAAYAAAHPYPDKAQASDHLRAAAIVNRANGIIKIYNFDNRPIQDANVWVNRSFIQHINGIAPNSSAIVQFGQLYNGMGKNFSSLNEPVSTVQVEMGNNLYTLEGPAAE